MKKKFEHEESDKRKK